MYVNRPAGQTSPYVAPAPVAGAGPAPVSVAVNNYQAQGGAVTTAGAGGILETIKGLLSGFVGFVKNIFGSLFGPKAPATTPTTPTTGTTGATSPADDATLAAQFGLLATPENIATFKTALASQQAEANVIGPGSADADAVTELQQLLNSWGYPVTQSGQFDPATADAVMKFKTANGLTETFQFANGQPGVTPFVDNRTRQKMVELLTNGQTPATGTTAGSTTTPPATSTPATTTPAAPAADTAAIASQYHLAADAANVAAFQAAATEALGKGAVGPGNTPADAVSELQQVLGQFGLTVPVTGQFDQATIDALETYKFQKGLTDPRFKMADGSAGILPYVDEATQQAMLAQLNAAPAATTPAATTPVTTTPAPATAATPVTTTPQYQAAGALSAEESQIAAQQGILATRENFDAFVKEAQALEAANAVGPGSTDKDAVSELQQVLTTFGIPVPVTGQFDQATVNAVLQYKKSKNLAASYKLADGTPAVHPFIDDATKNAMIAQLGG